MVHGSTSVEAAIPEMVLSQLNEQAYGRLKAEIMTGTLRPGQRLSASALAKRLGVSATPVREALQRLSNDGLVEVSPRRGTSVAEFTPQHVHETFHTRRIIEGAAVADLSQVPEETLERMEALVEQSEALREGDTFRDHQANIALDAEFHQRIVGLLKSRQLEDFFRKLRWPEQVLRGLSRSEYFRAQATVAEHAAICRALRQKDAVAARAAITDHLDRSEADLLARLTTGNKP